MDAALCRKLILSYICVFSIRDIDFIKTNRDAIIEKFADDEVSGDAFYKIVFDTVNLLNTIYNLRININSAKFNPSETKLLIEQIKKSIENLKSMVAKHVVLREIFLEDGTNRFAHKYLTTSTSIINTKTLFAAVLQLDPKQNVNQRLAAEQTILVENEETMQKVNITPIHIAALIGSQTAVEALVTNAADITLQASMWTLDQTHAFTYPIPAPVQAEYANNAITLTSIEANLITFPDEKVLKILYNAMLQNNKSELLQSILLKQIQQLDFDPLRNIQILRGIAYLVRLGASLQKQVKNQQTPLSLLKNKLANFKTVLELDAFTNSEKQDVNKQAAYIEGISIYLNLKVSGIFNLNRIKAIATEIDISKIRYYTAEDIEKTETSILAFLIERSLVFGQEASSSFEDTIMHTAGTDPILLPVLISLTEIDPKLINDPLSEGETPLYIALGEGCDVATIKFFMKHGANPNIGAPKGRSILEVAYTFSEYQENQHHPLDRLRTIFKYSKFPIQLPDAVQRNLLRTAIKNGDWHCIEFMQALGLNLIDLLADIMPTIDIRKCQSIETLALINFYYDKLHIPTEAEIRKLELQDETAGRRLRRVLGGFPGETILTEDNRDLFQSGKNIALYAIVYAKQFIHKTRDLLLAENKQISTAEFDEIINEPTKLRAFANQLFKDEKATIKHDLKKQSYANTPKNQQKLLLHITKAVINMLKFERRAVECVEYLWPLAEWNVFTKKQQLLGLYANGLMSAPGTYTSEGKSIFASLPSETIVGILEDLPIRDLAHLRLVSLSIGYNKTADGITTHLKSYMASNQLALQKEIADVLTLWWDKPDSVANSLQKLPNKFKKKAKTYTPYVELTDNEEVLQPSSQEQPQLQPS